MERINKIRRYLFYIIVALTFFSVSAFADTAKITSVKISPSSSATRFSFEITGGAFRYQWQLNAQTQQLKLSIQNTIWKTVKPPGTLSSPLVTNYRITSKANKSPLELTFQLKAPVAVKAFTQAAAAGKKAQLILELTPSPRVTATKKTIANKTAEDTEADAITLAINDLEKKDIINAGKLPALPGKSADEPSALPAKTQLPGKSADEPSALPGKPSALPATPSRSSGKPIIVVIDPGHGGKDPGAVGPTGVREKDVVLAISKELQAAFNQQRGFKALLTRRSDVFIPLRERLSIAQRANADIFIAIHADAAYNDQATGASVFALSEHGATSEGARWLAKKENESELLYGVTVSKDQVLRSVLLDLSQTHTIAVSLEMGRSILNKLSSITKLHYARVEQAAFVVLKSPDIPSLLIETGYISNPTQEQHLKNPTYQHRMADVIVQGVVSYFRQHPL